MPDMTIKREHHDDDNASAKRLKVESNGNGNMDAASNPYLAHWNDDKPKMKSEYGGGDGLAGFKRHATTTKQASVAEDGPNNPFTGQPLSSKYMSILRKRRDLPVHQQRYVCRSNTRHTDTNKQQQRPVPQALPGVADSRLRR
jgi:pre-mRNA-splicing factor ATP-dependent RNA helicase DHX15/PRP43